MSDKKEIRERIFTRDVLVGRTFRKRSVKESEMTAEDMEFYMKRLGNVFNDSPFGVQVWLVNEVAPKVQERLEMMGSRMAAAENVEASKEGVEEIVAKEVSAAAPIKSARKKNGKGTLKVVN